MTQNQQIAFWRGSFGDAYVDRNTAAQDMMLSRRMMWERILGALPEQPRSILEIGANIGLNLRALKELTTAELFAVEPNGKARKTLIGDGIVTEDHLFDATALAIPLPDNSVDFAFTSGVLIHIAPDDLLASCTEIHRTSGRYIACAEYFNPTPVDIDYRGERGFLFKRDFGGFWLDNFADLELVDYGFFWKRATGLDDLTWWLFRKRQ